MPRRLSLAALAALLVLLMPVEGVRAETLTCRMSASGTFSPGMYPVGGWGTFQISGSAGLTNETRCSYDDGPALDTAIATNGNFYNVVCGTAALNGFEASPPSETTIDVGRDGSLEVSAMVYRLQTYGWQAEMQIFSVNGRRVSEDGKRPVGVLSLRPQHACTFGPVSRFTIDGVFTLTW